MHHTSPWPEPYPDMLGIPCIDLGHMLHVFHMMSDHTLDDVRHSFVLGKLGIMKQSAIDCTAPELTWTRGHKQ